MVWSCRDFSARCTVSTYAPKLRAKKMSARGSPGLIPAAVATKRGIVIESKPCPCEHFGSQGNGML